MMRDRPEHIEKPGIFERSCQHLESELGEERFTLLLSTASRFRPESVMESIIQQIGPA
jgi:hypothetical protein